ncbi:MAG: hypothetical protein QM781_00830 [Chitinophagaceae bacterium]
MHILIFETTHFEAAYPLIRLFDVPGNRISIFCEEQTSRQLHWLLQQDATRFHWSIQSPGVSRRHFIDELNRYVQAEQVDWLWLNTVSDNFILFAALRKQLPALRMTVTLHALRSYTAPRISWSLRRIVRVWGKKKMRARFTEYNVLSPLLLPFAQQHLPQHTTIHTIPGGIFEEEKYVPATASPLHLVVPGSVDIRRRDYGFVYQLLHQAELAGLPLHISLAGGPGTGGQEWISRFRRFSGEYAQVRCFDEHVEQEEFDLLIRQAHFILHPSVKDTVLEDGAAESYGQTVYSGNFSDAIRHARPLIVPAALPIDPLVQSAVISYTDCAGLLDMLMQLHEHPRQVERYEQWALEVSRLFTADAIRTRYPSLFTNAAG